MPKHNVTILENGLKLILREDSRVDSVAVVVGVRAGSYYETKETAGIAHFLEHMLFEGTKKYPTAKSLAERIEAIGGYSTAYTDRGYVVYSVKVRAKHLNIALEYLSQIIFESKLEEKAINKEKRIVKEEISQMMDAPERAIWEKWMKWVWGNNHSLGRSILGDHKSIRKINKFELSKYLHRYYVPNNMTLAVVGNFSKSEVKTSIQKYFVINSAKKSINVTQQWVLPRKIFHTKLESFDALQVQMLCGFVTGISFSHKDRYIMQLITEILSGGVSARIFQKLVYELGIAYSVGAYDMQLNDTGIFFISGGVARENVDEAMKVIGDEIYNLRTIELTDEELLMAKERAITKFSFLAEKTDDLAGLYVIQQMREGKTFSIKELTENLMKVNSVDIKRVAQKYLCYSNLYIMLCGPVKKDGVKFINGMFDKLQ